MFTARSFVILVSCAVFVFFLVLRKTDVTDYVYKSAISQEGMAISDVYEAMLTQTNISRNEIEPYGITSTQRNNASSDGYGAKSTQTNISKASHTNNTRTAEYGSTSTKGNITRADEYGSTSEGNSSKSARANIASRINNMTFYMTSRHSGRLGNKMFQYAVLFGLTLKSTVWKPCIDRIRYVSLKPLFSESLTIPYCLNTPLDNEKSIGDAKGNVDLAITLLGKLPHANISLRGFFQSHKYFANAKRELRKEFAVSGRTRKDVKQFFKSVTPTDWKNTSYVRVGIHARRKDMASNERIEKYGLVNCTAVYYSHAMKYFEAMYPRVQFIVTSNSITWCKENIVGENVIYSNSLDYVMDFAILTMVDHVIISVGTFSWWVGWLCTGTTLYNGEQSVPGSIIALKQANDSWIPPNDEFNKWIPIT